MGIEFFKKEEFIEDVKVLVKIWDTAGQEQYKSLTRNFYRNSNGVIVVYDVTNRDSFDKVREWIECVKENAEENIRTILIGNKIDLAKTVHTDEGRKLAKVLKINFYETSAKENSGVNQAIGTLVSNVLKDILEQRTRPSSNDTNNIIDLKKGLSNEGEGKCIC
jgi:small GTP-binding protein